MPSATPSPRAPPATPPRPLSPPAARQAAETPRVHNGNVYQLLSAAPVGTDQGGR